MGWIAGDESNILSYEVGKQITHLTNLVTKGDCMTYNKPFAICKKFRKQIFIFHNADVCVKAISHQEIT